MTVKGAVLTLVALFVGGLLLFANTGSGTVLGLALITIAASAVITSLTRERRDDELDASKPSR
jgi:uncharacterized membrane protein